MEDFVAFLLNKVFRPKSIDIKYIDSAFEKTIADVRYHFPNQSKEEIENKITTNSNELAVFLFRLGRELHLDNQEDLKPQIHWLLKELCSCEIYFNNEIGEGFYIVHGEGTVIGSRNKIGKGFKIHQGCTIGHRKNNTGNGSIIHDNVTMYANSSIIGELIIEENVIIGAHVMIRKNLKNNWIVTQTNELLVRES